MGKTKGKTPEEIVFFHLLMLGQLEMIKMRLETREEFIHRKVFEYEDPLSKEPSLQKIGESKLGEEDIEKYGSLYDAMEPLHYYLRIHRGQRIVFQKKPVGTKQKAKKEPDFLMIPGFNL